jgi:RHS repeat-associated protein
LIQKWVNGTATDYSVILWATNEDVNGYDLRFRSSEYGTTSDRPNLEVVYSTEATTSTVYFLKDHLGSIRATVLDSADAPVIGYDDYDPWGYPLALRTKAIPTAYLQGASKYKFTGNEYDDDLGLNLGYHIDRYYDHMIGRWGVPDPVQQYSLSPYVYGANNPLIIVDPFGADTMFVDWPKGKRTSQYIPDIVVEAPRYAPLYDPDVVGLASGALESPLFDVDDLAGGAKFLMKSGTKIGAGVVGGIFIKKAIKKPERLISLESLTIAGKLLELIENGKGDVAMALMKEMAKTSEGRKALSEVHEAASRLIAYAKDNKAATVLKTLQDNTGKFIQSEVKQ